MSKSNRLTLSVNMEEILSPHESNSQLGNGPRLNVYNTYLGEGEMLIVVVEFILRLNLPLKSRLEIQNYSNELKLG